MSFQPTFTISNRMTVAITRIERARGFLEAAKEVDNVDVLYRREVIRIRP